MAIPNDNPPITGLIPSWEQGFNAGAEHTERICHAQMNREREDIERKIQAARLEAARRVLRACAADVRNTGSGSQQWLAEGWEQMDDEHVARIIGDAPAGLADAAQQGEGE